MPLWGVWEGCECVVQTLTRALDLCDLSRVRLQRCEGRSDFREKGNNEY